VKFVTTTQHQIHVEPAAQRIRATFNGEAIAESAHALILHETGHQPVYYFPPEDVRQDLLEPTELHTHCPYKGDASYWSIRVGDRVSENAMWAYLDPLPEREDIRGFRAFYRNRVDSLE